MVRDGIEATRTTTEDAPRGAGERAGLVQLAALVGALLVAGISFAAFDEMRSIRSTLAAAQSESRALRAREEILRGQALGLVGILPDLLERAGEAGPWSASGDLDSGESLLGRPVDRIASEALLARLLEQTRLLESLDDGAVLRVSWLGWERSGSSTEAASPASRGRAPHRHQASARPPHQGASRACRRAHGAPRCQGGASRKSQTPGRELAVVAGLSE